MKSRRHHATPPRPRDAEQGPRDEGSIRFVAQDSSGQCYLWSLRWGQAGYSCRSTRLTSFEAESLYAVLSQGDAVSSRACWDVFGGSDPSPRQASFALEENARLFFATNRDAQLRHWTGVMFGAIRTTESIP